MDHESLEDDESWAAFLDERLSPDLQAELDRYWRGSDAYLRAARMTVVRGRVHYAERGRPVEIAGRHWKLGVLTVGVEIKAGGLAILRPPGFPPGSEVRIYSKWQGRGRAATLRPTEVVMSGEVLPFGGDIPLAQYLAALNLRYGAGRLPPAHLKAPRDLPSPGQAPKIEFYRQVLDAYKALAAEGERAPAKELARRWGVEHSTMKTWIRRARQYLGEGET